MDKTRCPSCAVEYYASELTCPACGERNPAFAPKPAQELPAPVKKEAPPAEGGGWFGTAATIVLILVCLVGGGLKLHGDAVREKETAVYKAELERLLDQIAMRVYVTHNNMYYETTLQVEALVVRWPGDLSKPIPFSGALGDLEGRPGWIKGTWYRDRGEAEYTFAYRMMVGMQEVKREGSGSVKGPRPTAKPKPKI